MRRAAGLLLAVGIGLGMGAGATGCSPELDARPDASERVPVAVADLGEPELQATDTAWFAGGCFWCMEPPYDEVDGVVSTTSGFMGGTVANPSYEQVTGGGTGHIESVQVIFEPARVSYGQLLQIFWVNIDPLDDGGQFCDRGPIYRSAIFVRNEAQRELAEASLLALRESGRFSDPVVTRILDASPFYAAEEYHQGYYQKNPIRYRFYRTSCGRDSRLRQLWGD